MPDLDFKILGVEAANYGIVPLLHFKLDITNQPSEQTVQSVMLQTQIQIHPTLRHYGPEEKEKLSELFGTPDRWGQTLRARLWTHANPQIAPESPGDLFDGLEIDEILTLRVMAMSDAEKIEMRQVDEQTRKILERTENMPGDHLLKMHGVMRSVRSSNEDFFNPVNALVSATVDGVEVKAGDRVRIRPKKRADVFDLALDGKIAVIEAVEQDLEGGVQLALVLDDDPGRDLGMMRQPGHRFFYGTDEVEPVTSTE